MPATNVFLSYSHQDRGIASTIESVLRGPDLEVFRDDRVLVAGEGFDSEIRKAMKRADAIVVILSKNTSRSSWLEKELIKALETNKVVIPVLLDRGGKSNYVWPLIADRQAIEATGSEKPTEIARKVSKAIETALAKGSQK